MALYSKKDVRKNNPKVVFLSTVKQALMDFKMRYFERKTLVLNEIIRHTNGYAKTHITSYLCYVI